MVIVIVVIILVIVVVIVLIVVMMVMMVILVIAGILLMMSLLLSLLLLMMMMMLMCMICRFMTWCCNTVLVFPLNGSIRTCWIQPKMQRRLIVCDGWFDSMMSSTKVVQGSTGESLGRRHLNISEVIDLDSCDMFFFTRSLLSFTLCVICIYTACSKPRCLPPWSSNAMGMRKFFKLQQFNPRMARLPLRWRNMMPFMRPGCGCGYQRGPLI